MAKPILAIDFDGVLHSYTSGWQGYEVIPDPPVPGAVEFVQAAQEHFEVVVHSARAANIAGQGAIVNWLRANGFPALRITDQKPPARVYLDDRAVTFTGTFPDLSELLSFRPWLAKEEAHG